jgi:transcriptional regulator with XRE-family HTH domain
MIIGDRLRAVREEKRLSQGDIEKRTGLLRCYISRVENGHTVPAIETLEKMARAHNAVRSGTLRRAKATLRVRLTTDFPFSSRTVQKTKIWQSVSRTY